jgi:hypothetical protein
MNAGRDHFGCLRWADRAERAHFPAIRSRLKKLERLDG